MHWRIEASGPWALWTPPSFRAERYSQLVGSHDAMAGLLRGVLGHRAMNWTIHSVHILSEPRYLGLTQNELKFDGAGPYERDARQHTQRRNTYLRDVRYLIEASIALSRHADSGDSIEKFDSMFGERLRKGKQRRQTYFGIRECMALVEPWEGPLPTAIDLTQELGVCYYGTDFEDPETPQYFAPLSVVNGVVHYPSWDHVRGLGIARRTQRSA